MNAAGTMASKVEAYLSQRRHAAFALRLEGEQLARFARFADQAGHQGPLTVKLAIQWASASRRQNRLTAARRIEVLRPFARYCQQFEPTTQIPPRGLFGRAHRRLAPHIFTDDEICALLAACTGLSPPGGLRGASCATIFGLIVSTDLRISEATGLRRSDVDLQRGLLHIRRAKYGKSRWVPLHPTTTAALQHYVAQRDRDPRSTESEAFFVFDRARPASAENVRHAFKVLRDRLQWRARGDHRSPRIHDLRHTFICHRLECWYAQGLDIDRHILALSTYVGHAKVTDTYWYVTATPALLAIATQRFAPCPGGVRP
ncbi:MAG TPA: tyrosine-type recombinase/integrase [Gammaproteobacteria bacterium]|nr:tyrosine-type recombinase/integrase [Gammaproteobacteria bacterium]